MRVTISVVLSSIQEYLDINVQANRVLLLQPPPTAQTSNHTHTEDQYSCRLPKRETKTSQTYIYHALFPHLTSTTSRSQSHHVPRIRLVLAPANLRQRLSRLVRLTRILTSFLSASLFMAHRTSLSIPFIHPFRIVTYIANPAPKIQRRYW